MGPFAAHSSFGNYGEYFSTEMLTMVIIEMRDLNRSGIVDDSAITVPVRNTGRHHQHHPPPPQNHHHNEPDGEYLGALQVTLLPLAAGQAATVAQARAPDSDADGDKGHTDDQQDDDGGDGAGDDDYNDARSLAPKIYN